MRSIRPVRPQSRTSRHHSRLFIEGACPNCGTGCDTWSGYDCEPNDRCKTVRCLKLSRASTMRLSAPATPSRMKDKIVAEGGVEQPAAQIAAGRHSGPSD